jgi:hypothetical protein
MFFGPDKVACLAGPPLPVKPFSPVRGPFKGVPEIGVPSGVGPALPVPANVEIRPVLTSTRRMTWLLTSAMKRSLPLGLNCRLIGSLSSACRESH